MGTVGEDLHLPGTDELLFGWNGKLIRKPARNGLADIPEQIAEHLVERFVDRNQFIDQDVHSLFWFSDIHSGVGKKDHDDKYQKKDDQDRFGWIFHKLSANLLIEVLYIRYRILARKVACQ
jgi:hypothetical protein